MRKTILVADNNVYLDGEVMDSDCSELLAAGVHAVQWNGKEGEIEFIGHTKPNERITGFARFQKYFDRASKRIPPQPLGLPMDIVRFAGPEHTIVEFVGNDGRLLGVPWDHEKQQPMPFPDLIETWRAAGSPQPLPFAKRS